MVAVENRHQVAVDQGQRMVEVAGLGMLVIGAGDIVDAHFISKGLEAWAVAVIEQVDAQLVFWPVETQGRVDRATGHGQLLVVGRDQQIHHRPLLSVRGQLRRFAVQRP